jgi:hypothetical protein
MYYHEYVPELLDVRLSHNLHKAMLIFCRAYKTSPRHELTS